ncbi:hypothetical protein OAO92_05925 [Paracoccaceae bacterium]|nr:hypothetical protein [Paracoccaceae bacterium]
MSQKLISKMLSGKEVYSDKAPNCIGWTINNAIQKTTALFAESVDMTTT